MNVLIVSLWTISNRFIGGTERFVVDLAENLVRQGDRVTVLMLNGDEFEQNGVIYRSLRQTFNFEINELSLKKKYFKNFSLKDLDNFGSLVSNSFDASKFDIVHLNSLMMIAAFKDKKRVFTLHENPFEVDHNWGINTYKLLQKVVKSIDHKDIKFTAPSNHYSKIFEKDLGVGVYTIPHSIDCSRLKTQLSKGDLIKKYKLPRSVTYCLMPSRLEVGQKCQDLALYALAQTPDSARFHIIMSGIDSHYRDNVRYLKEIAKKNKLNVSFIAFDNMAEAYKVADMVLLPSRSESFGYAALESLSLGIPTVLSKIPTFIEISSSASSSFLCSLNKDDLADKIEIAKGVRRKRDIKLINKYNASDWVKKYVALYEK